MQPIDDVMVGKRIEEVMNDKRPKSVRAFALSLGADPSFFGKILKGERALPDSYADELETKYGVNKDWLRTGTGQKYKVSEPEESEDSYRTKYIKQLEKENNFLQELVKSNLTLVLATVREISVRQEADGEVLFESLARVEGEPDKPLLEDARKRRDRKKKLYESHDKSLLKNK